MKSSLNIYRNSDKQPPKPLFGKMAFQEYAEKEKRSLSTGASGEPVIDQDQLATELVEYLGYNNPLADLGVRFVTDNNYRKYPVVSGIPEMVWHAENTADLTDDSGLTLSKREVTYKTLSTKIIKVSREYLEDAGELGERIIDSAIATAISNKLIQTVMQGTGTGQPFGLDNLVGKQTYASTGVFSVQLYDDFIRAYEQLLAVNVAPGNVGLLHGTNTWKLLNLLKDDYGAYLTPPPFWMNLPKAMTAAVDETYGTPDTTRVYMGDFSQLIIGTAKQSPVTLKLVERYSDALQVAFIAYLRLDFTFLRPNNFLVMTGVSLQET